MSDTPMQSALMALPPDTAKHDDPALDEIIAAADHVLLMHHGACFPSYLIDGRDGAAVEEARRAMRYAIAGCGLPEKLAALRQAGLPPVQYRLLGES